MLSQPVWATGERLTESLPGDIKIIKQLACAVLVSGACVAANAATVDLGDITIGTPTPFSGSMFPAGGFNDFFTFVLPGNGGSGYTVMNLPLSIPGVGTLNTLLTTMTLFSNPDDIMFNADDAALHSVSVLPDPDVNSLSFTFGSTLAGPMYLNVTGVTSGTLGGIYNGAISVSPVPEPETWAMMLIGAGLVGFQLRRKSKQASANRFV